jgi:hypothetical protein
MINNDKPRGLNKRFLSFGCAVAEVVGIAKVAVKTNTTQGFKAKEVWGHVKVHPAGPGSSWCSCNHHPSPALMPIILSIKNMSENQRATNQGGRIELSQVRYPLEHSHKHLVSKSQDNEGELQQLMNLFVGLRRHEMMAILCSKGANQDLSWL